ncbi:MAG: hypothetical protein WC958_05110 [Dehalococcoidales bacterium]
MIIPPLFIKIKMVNNKTNINLWLPLFLVWLIIAPLALILSPLVLIIALVLYPFGWGKPLLQLGPRIYSVLCNLKDLKIDIKGKDELELYFR